jgi:hypothetical protein
MKVTRKFLFCLAGGLALNAAVRADDAASPGNPYTTAVVRNIFGLNPPAPVDPNAQADANPPPKITPNGITDILGQLQVLFKVANPAKAGKPAADDDYILSEGQRQDDIEVVKIDEKACVVTFNNHGETQELPLVAGTASSPAPAAGGNPGIPGIPTSGFKPAPGGFTRPLGNTFNGSGGLGGNYAGSRGNANNGMNGGGNNGVNNSGGTGGGLNFGNPSSPNSAFHNAAAQIPEGMTPEVQTIAIEAGRQAALQSGNTEAAAMLPITELTPQQNGGSP